MTGTLVWSVRWKSWTRLRRLPFLPLKPFHERRNPALSADAIAAELRRRFRQDVPEARIYVFGPPTVDGLGTAGGFKLMVEAAGDVDFDALQAQADELAAQGNRQPGLVGLFSGFRAGRPSFTWTWTELLAETVQSDRTVPGILQQNPFMPSCARGRARLLRACGPVRELVAADGGNPGCAHVPIQRAGGIALAQMDVNIFVQVGFVVLVGLAAKNAILIVEFARDRQQEGATRFDAAVEAAARAAATDPDDVVRLHSGVFPLVIAHGAGAEMRRTLGTAVFAGMIGVTLFGIFLTPVFFYVIRRFSGSRTPVLQPADEEDDGQRRAT